MAAMASGWPGQPHGRHGRGHGRHGGAGPADVWPTARPAPIERMAAEVGGVPEEAFGVRETAVVEREDGGGRRA